MSGAGGRDTAAGLEAPRPRLAASASRPVRVALLGPYSSRNLGDTAIQRAVIEQLRLRRPGLEIVGLSPEPDDTFRSLGIPAFALQGPGRPAGGLEDEFPVPSQPPGGGLRAAASAWRAGAAFARRLDLLIVSGGGQLDDFWGGAWGHPWSLLRWSALARLHGVPVAVLGVGMDRLSNPLSRRFAAAALRLAAYRAFRDEGTLAAVGRLGLRRGNRLCPDLAFALALEPPAPGARTSERRYAVVNPLSEKTWSHRPGARDGGYLVAVADAGCWLAAQGLGIRIACSQPAMDGPDAARLQALLRARGVEDAVLCPIERVEDYLSQVAGAEFVIAARLHGALLALRAGSPVIALSPLPKVAQLMRDVGLPGLCLPLQGLDSADLVARCADVLGRAVSLRAHIARVNEDFRARLAQAFDDVARLLP